MKNNKEKLASFRTAITEALLSKPVASKTHQTPRPIAAQLSITEHPNLSELMLTMTMAIL